MNIAIQLNDIQKSVPVKDGYYLLVVVVVDNTGKEIEKIVPSELRGKSFYKLNKLLHAPEIYDKKDILAWGKIPEEYYRYTMYSCR